MPRSPRPDAGRFGTRSTFQLIASLLLAVTPASANGTFDFDPCSEPDVRKLHIDRTLELVSVTRDGQALDLAAAPALIWDGEQASAADYTVSAPTAASVPSFGLLRAGRQVAFFTIVTDTTESTP